MPNRVLLLSCSFLAMIAFAWTFINWLGSVAELRDANARRHQCEAMAMELRKLKENAERAATVLPQGVDPSNELLSCIRNANLQVPEDVRISRTLAKVESRSGVSIVQLTAPRVSGTLAQFTSFVRALERTEAGFQIMGVTLRALSETTREGETWDFDARVEFLQEKPS